MYAITHGKKGTGCNPPLTDDGKEQIARAAELLRGKNFSLIAIATGQRFIDTADVVCRTLDISPKRVYSPLLGSGDSDARDPQGEILVLLQGGQTMPMGDYIGVSCAVPGWDPWLFIGCLYDTAEKLGGELLLVTDREFMEHPEMAVEVAKSATVYELGYDCKAVEMTST